MNIENIDEKLLYLMHKLFKMSSEDEKRFLDMIKDFSEQEKIDLAYDLWKQIQKEQNIIKRFYNKVKSLYIRFKEKSGTENHEELLAML